ncbi:hypothetical protein [Pseudoalteromonas sp. MMG012]|uniref:hypothetical protein n=1 Tax=Pseudoalteromonas sp. MMG012 TaxID=2822686 RepID=UPI001B39DB1D|nr:hypothetical protein [Pseudoalteromonas sp. MMG012]MBQ4851845.1 hypothetical protein [Pseudoalteromonas sp. MMG012]
MKRYKLPLIRMFIGACALLCVATLFIIMLLIKGVATAPKETVIHTKIDVATLPPPPPPPPILETQQSSSSTAALNVVGLTGNVAMQYSDTPTMAMPKVSDLKRPELDLKESKIIDTFSSSIPMLQVEHLDRVPIVVRQQYIKPPKSIRKYGNKRIETKVELIIDQTGKPYIKKIVDAVYPEMVDTIREWVRHARFEIPKKEGRPVQAVYFYGINFNYG